MDEAVSTIEADQKVAASATIRNVSTSVPRNAWDAVYTLSAHALPSQSRLWASVVESSGGYRNVSRHYEFADGCEAVLPLFAGKLPSPALAPQFSPPSAWGFGGLLSTEKLNPGHVRAVLNDLATTPAVLTQIRPDPLQAEIWSQAAPAGWQALPRAAHVLKLDGNFQEVWSKHFRSDTRNRIRRAERAGLEVVSGNSAELVSGFHQLLQMSFTRWAKRQKEPAALARFRGLRRDPEAKFLAMATSAGSLFRLWLARLEGKPVAAILVLRDREAHYTRGAMNEELAGPTFANYLLHSKAIEEACAAGCTYYHMGETKADSSLAQFKSRFGAVLHPYAEYRYERLPISWVTNKARSAVKRLIGFRDV